MTWVLLVYVGFIYNGGPTVVPGFHSSEACEVAATGIRDDLGHGLLAPRVITLCLEVK